MSSRKRSRKKSRPDSPMPERQGPVLGHGDSCGGGVDSVGTAAADGASPSPALERDHDLAPDVPHSWYELALNRPQLEQHLACLRCGERTHPSADLLLQLFLEKARQVPTWNTVLAVDPSIDQNESPVTLPPMVLRACWLVQKLEWSLGRIEQALSDDATALRALVIALAVPHHAHSRGVLFWDRWLIRQSQQQHTQPHATSAPTVSSKAARSAVRRVEAWAQAQQMRRKPITAASSASSRAAATLAGQVCMELARWHWTCGSGTHARTWLREAAHNWVPLHELEPVQGQDSEPRSRSAEDSHGPAPDDTDRDTVDASRARNVAEWPWLYPVHLLRCVWQEAWEHVPDTSSTLASSTPWASLLESPTKKQRLGRHQRHQQQRGHALPANAFPGLAAALEASVGPSFRDNVAPTASLAPSGDEAVAAVVRRCAAVWILGAQTLTALGCGAWSHSAAFGVGRFVSMLRSAGNPAAQAHVARMWAQGVRPLRAWALTAEAKQGGGGGGGHTLHWAWPRPESLLAPLVTVVHGTPLSVIASACEAPAGVRMQARVGHGDDGAGEEVTLLPLGRGRRNGSSKAHTGAGHSGTDPMATMCHDEDVGDGQGSVWSDSDEDDGGSDDDAGTQSHVLSGSWPRGGAGVVHLAALAGLYHGTERHAVDTGAGATPSKASASPMHRLAHHFATPTPVQHENPDLPLVEHQAPGSADWVLGLTGMADAAAPLIHALRSPAPGLRSRLAALPWARMCGDCVRLLQPLVDALVHDPNMAQPLHTFLHHVHDATALYALVVMAFPLLNGLAPDDTQLWAEYGTALPFTAQPGELPAAGAIMWSQSDGEVGPPLLAFLSLVLERLSQLQGAPSVWLMRSEVAHRLEQHNAALRFMVMHMWVRNHAQADIAVNGGGDNGNDDDDDDDNAGGRRAGVMGMATPVTLLVTLSQRLAACDAWTESLAVLLCARPLSAEVLSGAHQLVQSIVSPMPRLRLEYVPWLRHIAVLELLVARLHEHGDAHALHSLGALTKSSAATMTRVQPMVQHVLRVIGDPSLNMFNGCDTKAEQRPTMPHALMRLLLRDFASFQA